jgi:glycosyltransferase involved in cell wall biosynthesis
MKNLLAILPKLVESGWKVEAWCVRSDAPPELCKHTFFPGLKRFPAVEMLLFALLVNLRALWRWATGSRDARVVVHSSGGYHLGADVASVHFMGMLWVRLQFRLGVRSVRELGAFLFSCFGGLLDWLMYALPMKRLYLPVSDSVADEVRKRQKRDCSTITIPSVYDPAKFNPTFRAEARLQSRTDLGYSQSDIVLAFTSQGGYRRKGLFLGLEALKVVRKTNPNVKLLVIGGNPAVIARLKRQLDTVVPDWQGWVQVAGHVPDLARALCAADAFFFPSYFESFASVELEAAALGIPLLLTRHFGIEMTLRPGINGELLSFQPLEMAAQITAALPRLSEYDRSGENRGITVTQFGERILAAYETAIGCQPKPPELTHGH